MMVSWSQSEKQYSCTSEEVPWFQERTSDATITINLQDVNDNYPEFDKSEYSANIVESALPASLVLTVSASDKDTGKNGQIIYSIKGEGSDAFTIHPNEGHIRVKATPAGRSNLGKKVFTRLWAKILKRMVGHLQKIDLSHGVWLKAIVKNGQFFIRFEKKKP